MKTYFDYFINNILHNRPDIIELRAVLSNRNLSNPNNEPSLYRSVSYIEKLTPKLINVFKDLDI